MGGSEEVDIRQPSINTEPRTLSESTLQQAKEAAQDIMQQNPEPSSDIFTKDATDIATRQTGSTAQGQEDDSLANHLDEMIQKADKVVDANQKQAAVKTKNPDAPSSQSST